MKVLIVDDDPDVRSFLSETVKLMGAESVDSASSGEEALAVAIQQRYDLVTLDIKMPGVSGVDILSVLRGMMPWAVIAIVSGFVDEVPEVALDHIDLVLSKPVRVDTLQKLMTHTRELVEKRETIRKLGHPSVRPENA
jgi:YesN/AraC family two-component response regulator